MSHFADSSAVVKLYADESGSDEIRALTTLVISDLTRVEVPAALWRKERLGFLGTDLVHVLIDEFESAVDPTRETVCALVNTSVTEPLIDSAARLTGVHRLRGYDAVQLATAIAVRDADPSCDTFAAFDRDLRIAAAHNGFALLPAQLPA